MSSKNPLVCIILAAGLGKRLNNPLPKAAVSTSERPLIQHILASLAPLGAIDTVLVLGHGKDLVKEIIAQGGKEKPYSLENLIFAEQKEQRGTGDAARVGAESFFAEHKIFTGTFLLVYGDTPLITSETLKDFLKFHHAQKATISLISFLDSPTTAYGRVFRSADKKQVEKIVERKDCSQQEIFCEEMNSGIYAVDSAFLLQALKDLSPSNAQAEYYLTDIVARAHKEGQRVCAYLAQDAEEFLGVNTQQDLVLVNQVLNKRRITRFIEQGVTFLDPKSVLLGSEVLLEAGVIVGPNVQIYGKTSIGAGTVIEGSAYMENSRIAQNCHLKLGVRIESAELGEGVSVGPFANLRPETKLGKNVRIGNFVETKKANIHDGAKANHLSYLGDCEIGTDSNIGAGTITCNYDGVNKHHTSIGKNVFVGSDSILVAPVTIEDGAYVAAGSVVPKATVPRDSLAIARAVLVIKQDWVKKKA